MLDGFRSIAAAVVINRKKPIWVNRENAMNPFSLAQQWRAAIA